MFNSMSRRSLDELALAGLPPSVVRVIEGRRSVRRERQGTTIGWPLPGPRHVLARNAPVVAEVAIPAPVGKSPPIAGDSGFRRGLNRCARVTMRGGVYGLPSAPPIKGGQEADDERATSDE